MTVRGTGNPTSPPTGSIDARFAVVVERAVADLARRLDLAPEAISVVSASAVTWPDRSIGCPKPGVNYAQVTVDGAQVMLGAAGKSYDYHSGGDGQPVLCEKTFTATSITPDTPST